MEDNMKAVFDKWEGRFSSATNTDKPCRNTDMLHKVIEDGRQKWRAKFGDIRPSQVTSRRQEWKRIEAKMPSSSQVMLERIAGFKSAPTIQADEFRVSRPFMGQCCACLPKSKHEACDKMISEMGLTNLLDTHKHVAKMGPLARQFSTLAYILQKRAFHKYANVTVGVLHCHRVRDTIEQKTISDLSDSLAVLDCDSSSVNRLERCARSILLTMSANISNVFFTLTGWMLLKLLPTVLSSLQVHNGQIHRLKQIAQKDIPIVYLPTHRSHLDYILVTFALWNHGIRLPHIASGNNLDLPFFGWLIRRLGGFFIRRKLDHSHGKRDDLYRSLLHSYIEELLKQRECFELFLEGGRSRSGKSCTPKTGLLSVVVEACLQNAVDDVYIIPVSISYERLLDGNFIREQMGMPKVNETFLGVLRSFLGLLFGEYGSVRLDFSQAFSLREFIQVYSKHMPNSTVQLAHVSNGIDPADADPSPDSPSAESLCSSNDSYTSLTSITSLSLNHRQLVKQLAEHVCYDCSRNSALMSTNLVSFLLMTKHRTPVTMPALVQSFQWLKEQLNIQCRDVGYTGKPEDVIEHACTLLGPELVSIGKDENHNHPVIQANLSIPRVFELCYYANAVTPVFIMQSIMVNAALAMSNIKLQVVASGGQVVTALVSKDKIIETASELCLLFRHEFIFVRPCKNLQTELADVLEDLITTELISVQEDKVHEAMNRYDAQRMRRIVDSLAMSDDDCDDSDDDDIYNVSYRQRHVKDEHRVQLNITRQDCIERIHFHQQILAPYVEAYWWTLTSLIAAGDKQLPEEDFLRRLQNEAIDRVERGLVEHAEYCAMETLKNVIHSLQDLQLLDSFHAGNLKMIAIHDTRQASVKMREYTIMLQKLVE